MWWTDGDQEPKMAATLPGAADIGNPQAWGDSRQRDWAVDRDHVGTAGYVHLAIDDRGRYELSDRRHLVASGIHVAVPQLVGQVGRVVCMQGAGRPGAVVAAAFPQNPGTIAVCRDAQPDASISNGIDGGGDRGGIYADTGDLITFHRIPRSEEHTSELQSLRHLVCRL